MKAGQSLFFSIAAWVAAGFILLHAVFFIYWGHERMLARAETFAEGIVDRTLSLRNMAPSELAKLNALSGPAFNVRRLMQPQPLPERGWPHNDEIEQAVHDRLAAWGFAPVETVRFGYTLRRHRQPAAFHLLIPTDPAGNEWLHAVARTDTTRFGYDVASALFTMLSVLTAIFLVLYATRRTTRYISALADGAEQFGSGLNVAPLPENQGPVEARRASRKFNEMQRRVAALLDQHIQMLGAVSHDLRTIATRMGLRIERIGDEDARLRIGKDLEQMTTILSEAMTYAREEASDEPFEAIDLVSLIQAVVDDLADLGGEVTFSNEGNPVVRGQPAALKRAFYNLADNALRYGETARVRVDMSGDVRITDSGSGMTEEQVAEALQPFVRLDESRNRALGGTGLGLTIAASIIARHKGKLEFAHSPEGFQTIVRFPAARQRAGR